MPSLVMMNIFRSTSRTRHILIAIWWASLIVDLAIMVYLYTDDWIGGEHFQKGAERINALFAPYLGAITVFYWSGEHTGSERTKGSKQEETPNSSVANILAIGSSLLWNGMIFFFLARLLIPSGTLEDSLETIDKLGGFFTWLVAPALGFYFAKSGSSKE